MLSSGNKEKDSANAYKGLFIVFEGIDGSGKDTQIDYLRQRLEQQGLTVEITSEPWTSPEGISLRKIAKAGRADLKPVDEVELYFADRRAHVNEVILPALKEGKIVLCSRYYYSTMAYQGAVGIDPVWIQKRSEAEFPIPDAVILLEVAVDEAIERILASRPDGLEAGYEKAENLRQVHGIFAALSAPYIHRIRSEPAPQETAGEIYSVIIPLLRKIQRR